MKAYGSIRTYANCRVISARAGRARKFKLFIKNPKAGRIVEKEQNES